MVARLVARQFLLLDTFFASVLVVHFRGRVRLGFGRPLTDRSTLMTPYNALIYLFSAVQTNLLFRSRRPAGRQAHESRERERLLPGEVRRHRVGTGAVRVVGLHLGDTFRAVGAIMSCREFGHAACPQTPILRAASN